MPPRAQSVSDSLPRSNRHCRPRACQDLSGPRSRYGSCRKSSDSVSPGYASNWLHVVLMLVGFHDKPRGSSLTEDVTGRTPRICRLVSPGLNIGATPFAKTVQDGAILSFESISHDHVSLRCVRLTIVVSVRTVVSRSAYCQFNDALQCIHVWRTVQYRYHSEMAHHRENLDHMHCIHQSNCLVRCSCRTLGLYHS